MAGNQTHNYDFVMELSERFYTDLLGALFDTDGFLCSILDRIGAGDLCGAFTVDVLLDRPADVPVPASARDLLDIRINLGEAGSAGRLRMVVGADVDRSDSGTDTVRLNLQDRLFFAEASIVGLPIPSDVVSNVLRNQIRFIPLPPSIPVDRASGDATEIRRADVRIIDDASATDLDASALLLTWGGGIAGDAAAFTQSFVPEGGRGAIAIFFNWLCRIIEPALEGALSLPAGSFSQCRLRQTVRIDEDEEVDLTRLELSLADGFINVTAAVRKSGFCYEATGTVTARIRIEIEDGQLIVESEVDDPDIDIDIPWYCWIAGAAIGALLGGILFGAIGAIVGAVIIPLITWIASEIIEGIVERVADRVADAINQVSPDVNVPAVGINLIFQRVFIDDIVIKMQVEPIDNVPIRSEGTLVVREGQYVDLDSGRVGDESLPGADLAWEGRFLFGRLKTVCNSGLARTGSKSFQSMTRSRLYTFTYESPGQVTLPELATLDPLGILTGDLFDETLNVYDVQTNEERYAAIRVVEVEQGSIRLRYKTYEKFLPTLEIKGEFKCESIFFPPKDAVVAFEPTLGPKRVPLAGARLAAGTAEVARAPADLRASVQDICDSLVRANLAALPRDVVEKSFYARTRLADRRVGRWIAEFLIRSSDVGRFDAITNGLRAPLSYTWAIEGQMLEGANGEVLVKGVTMRYALEGRRLTLSVRQGQAIEFELKATVTDAKEMTLTTTRCVKYAPQCAQTVRYIPNWNTYRAAHLQHFGVVEVPPIQVAR